MPNVTLSVDEETIKKVRKIAIDQNTTLTAMIREFLKSVAERGGPEKDRAVRRVKDSFAKYSRDMGQRTWRREDLHER
jgi:hypothetical protein